MKIHKSHNSNNGAQRKRTKREWQTSPSSLQEKGGYATRTGKKDKDNGLQDSDEATLYLFNLFLARDSLYSSIFTR